MACVLLLVTFAHGQNSQFLFDANGNLFVQSVAVTAPPQILGQPQNVFVAPGEATSFFVVAADTRLLSYQWRFNGTNIGGGTNDALLLQNVSTNNEGEYRVVLTNPSGSVTSAPAMLWIDSDADGVPDSWELSHFGNLTNSATADFDHDGVSNLQEYLDGTNPTNSASVLFRLTVQHDGGSVAILPDQSTYTNGQTVTLTATAFSNEVFRAWLGDVVTRSNTVTLVMTNNRTVFARFTPIVFTWTNLAGGDWNSATNWMPSLVPGSNDSVVIDGGVFNTSFPGTITLDAPADCATVILGSFLPIASPTLTGSGTLTVRESLVWRGGTMSGSGRTVLESGASLTLDAAGTLVLTTRTLELGGETFWTAANFSLNNAVITNRAGAVFHARSAGSINWAGGSSRFDNAGTFRKAGSLDATTVANGVSFNNSGAMEIQTGALNLGGGGAHSGSFAVSAGAGLVFSGGTHSATGSSSITGAGQLTVSGGTADLAGLVNVSGSNTVSGGTANLTGNYICTNNTLTISGGTANFNGSGLLSPAQLNLSNGTLGGSNLVTVLNQMNWTGGTMSGSGRTVIQPAATLNAAIPSLAFLSARTLENAGTVLFTGAGVFAVNSSAVITNRPGALFRIENENASGLGGGGASGRFDNAGTFRKSAGTGTSTVASGVSFNNSGTVEIQTGTLRLLGGGTHSGSFAVPAGTALTLSGGTHTSDASATITGSGQLAISGGTANLAGLVNISGSNTFSGGTANLAGNYFCTNNTLTISGTATANFNGTGSLSPAVVNLSGDTLGGSNLVTVLSQMNWTAGTMSGSGRTIIAPGATLNAAIPSLAFLSGRTLENAGTTVFTGAGVFAVNSSAVITNWPGALFRIENENASGLGGGGANGRFDNAGSFRKSAGVGTTTIVSGMKFTNYNTVDIRSGKLAANGGYVSSSNALLNCAVGGTTAGTNYGQLQVAGTVVLNGGLSVDLLPGYSPASNDSFIVVTAATRSNVFATFSYPSNRVTLLLSNSPTAVILRTTEVFPIPQPVLLTPQLAGSNALLTWTATSNVTYRLEFNPDLAPTNWNAVPGDVTTLSNTASKLDPLTPSNRVYRVRVLP